MAPKDSPSDDQSFPRLEDDLSLAMSTAAQYVLRKYGVLPDDEAPSGAFRQALEKASQSIATWSRQIAPGKAAE